MEDINFLGKESQQFILNKYLGIAILGGLILLRPLKSSAQNSTHGLKILSPINPAVVRNDHAGKGTFGAKRGARIHRGLDLVASEYEDVYCPIDGVMNRFVQVYENDTRFTGCEIVGTGKYQGWKIKLFYMVPADFRGMQVRKGDYIGYMQAISDKYPGSQMKDHIHIEVFKNGKRVDPLPMIEHLNA